MLPLVVHLGMFLMGMKRHMLIFLRIVVNTELHEAKYDYLTAGPLSILRILRRYTQVPADKFLYDLAYA